MKADYLMDGRERLPTRTYRERFDDVLYLCRLVWSFEECKGKVREI